ncbi:MAG: polyhydroxyalkanoate synthesis repressor PhaR [Sphingomonadales bacterium]|jgi:polyhydroxyalkanoate synthesis repressor PhaR
MAKTKNDDVIVIKKYANRRLYNTGASSYVTLDDLAQMVKNGDDFVVQDAKTGEDITRSVLTQIIVEEEAKGGQTLLPISFLRQLIAFYGQGMQGIVPQYLESAMSAFTAQQDKWRDYMMSQGFSNTGFGSLDEMARQNMAMFEQATRMFTDSFSKDKAETEEKAPEEAKPTSRDDIDQLKEQMAALKEQLDKLVK